MWKRMPAAMRNKGDAEIELPEFGQGVAIMLIRIRGTDGGELYGDIVQYYLQEPVPFQNMKELVFRIDAIGRFLKPDSGEKFHSLREENRRGGRKNHSEVQMPERRWKGGAAGSPGRRDFSSCFSMAGVKAVLDLELIGRRNMSLQGRIWGKPTGRRRISFRSVLELMVLLSELQESGALS